MTVLSGLVNLFFIYHLAKHCSNTPYSEKFWRGKNLAMGQIGLFGEDLIWRYPIFIKFGEDLIWRWRKFSLNFANLTSEFFPEIRKSLIQIIKQRKNVFAETFLQFVLSQL